jgi:hypothetical protein
MENLLKCKLCDYEAKQLFQHIKSAHNISVDDYRNMFGCNEKMQINFTPTVGGVNNFNSLYVKEGYVKIFSILDDITEMYSIDETIHLLKTKFYYKNYFGRAKNRTLIKENPKLYKSIYHYTKIIETTFSKINKDKGNYNFVKRLIFLAEYNADIDKLKCECGKTYTWNVYCRYCPIDRAGKTGTTMPDEVKLKCRTSTLKYLESLNGQLLPRYNKKSIPMLEQTAKQLGIADLQHAENGGEFHIKELGYWVDGYSKEKNIVIEYDEKHHFDADGNLKVHDVKRQVEIENYLKCKFIRINKYGIYNQS